MLVLGIETATTVCGIALARDGIISAERWVDERYVHAERIFGFIDEVLISSGTDVRVLDAIAVSIGPGSFTGLRIGLSVAKGLHAATGAAIVPVPTLEALAFASNPAAQAAGATMLCAVLDARRDEVYAQLFDIRGNLPESLGDVAAVAIQDLVPRLPVSRLALTGDARENLAAAMLAAGGRKEADVVSLPIETARCTAASVATLGESLIRSGEHADPELLEPRYVRDFFRRTND